MISGTSISSSLWLSRFYTWQKFRRSCNHSLIIVCMSLISVCWFRGLPLDFTWLALVQLAFYFVFKVFEFGKSLDIIIERSILKLVVLPIQNINIIIRGVLVSATHILRSILKGLLWSMVDMLNHIFVLVKAIFLLWAAGNIITLYRRVHYLFWLLVGELRLLPGSNRRLFHLFSII